MILRKVAGKPIMDLKEPKYCFDKYFPLTCEHETTSTLV